jgi:hypothetical protein
LSNTVTPEELALDGIRFLTELCGSDAQKKGWHEDRPEDPALLQIWQGNKLMLMVSELVEAHDEIRTGHTADETYYPDAPAPGTITTAEVKVYKPEGVPSELADTVIRIFDFCYTEGIDLGQIIQEKLTYNRTRAYKHGKAF